MLPPAVVVPSGIPLKEKLPCTLGASDLTSTITVPVSSDAGSRAAAVANAAVTITVNEIKMRMIMATPLSPGTGAR
jgi:hypothetical protein